LHKRFVDCFPSPTSTPDPWRPILPHSKSDQSIDFVQCPFILNQCSLHAVPENTEISCCMRASQQYQRGRTGRRELPKTCIYRPSNQIMQSRDLPQKQSTHAMAQPGYHKADHWQVQTLYRKAFCNEPLNPVSVRS
jgi:hypothetical protein